jgi:hypothetical protein
VAVAVGQKNPFDGRQIALAMLAVAALRHYGWEIAPPELRGLLSKALGAMAILALVWIIDSLVQHWGVRLVALVWTWEQLQTVICSAWYAVEPWPVPVGVAMCSAKAGFDLGAVGVMFVAVVLWRLLTNRKNCEPL